MLLAVELYGLKNSCHVGKMQIRERNTSTLIVQWTQRYNVSKIQHPILKYLHKLIPVFFFLHVLYLCFPF